MVLERNGVLLSQIISSSPVFITTGFENVLFWGQKAFSVNGSDFGIIFLQINEAQLLQGYFWHRLLHVNDKIVLSI